MSSGEHGIIIGFYAFIVEYKKPSMPVPISFSVIFMQSVSCGEKQVSFNQKMAKNFFGK